GVEAIHRVGIVHRDLKTLNVMIDAHGAAKVMDFGIAKKVVGEGTPAPSGSYVVGSPEYMSPEQARGQPVDFRSDIYALGIIVFELFTGRVPFRGDTPVATLLMHLEAPPPLEGPAASAIPLSARPVLRKALAKDPDERYRSARDMADAPPEPPATASPAPWPTPPQAAAPSPAAVGGLATPVPSASPSPAPPSPEADGWLLVLARPYANVTVDDRPQGQTPLARLALKPGPHSVVLSNPDYQDFRRKVTIRSG